MLFPAAVCATFVLMNAIPILGAYFAARALNRGGHAELWTLFAIIYAIIAISSFGIPGISGKLTPLFCCGTSFILGGLLCLCKKYEKPLQEEKPFTFREKFLVALCTGILAHRFFLAAIMHSGTDSFLYHLYYPAMWITDGKIHLIPIEGLPHEYFPFYGELLFGYLMMPLGDASFAFFLQTAAAAALCAGILSFTKKLRFRRIDGLAACVLMLYTGIIGENSIQAYTDVLTGAFLACGVAITLSGSTGNGKISHALLGGIALGIAAGIKYSGLIAAPVAGLFLVIYFMLRKKHRFYAAVFTFGAVFTGAIAYLGNFIRTGNPFFPVRIGTLFPQGIDFARPTLLSSGTNPWTYFVQGGQWDLNVSSAIFYLILPFAVSGIVLFGKKEKRIRRTFFLFLSSMIVVIALVQYAVYPEMTQPRQIIPLLMLSSLLIPALVHPYSGEEKDWKKSFFQLVLISVAAFLLCVTENIMKLQHEMCFILFFVLAACIPKRKFFVRAIVVTGILAFCALPILFQIRFDRRNENNMIFGGRAGGRAAKILLNEYIEKMTVFHIASVGTWHRFMFMEDIPGTRVEYVPVSEKDSVHVHEFAHPADMRNKPIAFEKWMERLRKRKISFVAVDLASHTDYLENRALELRWMMAYPEYFEEIVSDGNFYFFRFVPKN